MGVTDSSSEGIPERIEEQTVTRAAHQGDRFSVRWRRSGWGRKGLHGRDRPRVKWRSLSSERRSERIDRTEEQNFVPHITATRHEEDP